MNNNQADFLHEDLISALSDGVYRIRAMPLTAVKMPGQKSYRLEFASDKCCAMLGIPRQQLMEDPSAVYQKIYPEDLSGFFNAISEAKKTRTSFAWEGRMELENGLRWMHLESLPRQLENGDVLWTGTIRDITGQKNTEERIRREAKRLELEHCLQDLVSENEKDYYSFALEAIVELTGSEAGYFHQYDEDTRTITFTIWSKKVFRDCSSSFGPHCPLTDAGIWADSIRRREPVVHNDYMTDPSRKGLPEGHFPVKRHLGVPVFDGGRIVAAIGVGNKREPYANDDVSSVRLFMQGMWKIIARRRSEAARQSSEARFKHLIESVPDGVFYTDNKQRIVQINQSGACMFGYEFPEQMIGKPMVELWKSAADRARFMEELERNGAVRQYEFAGRTRSGREIFLENSSTINFDKDGTFEGTEGIIRDVTERRKLEEHVRHLQKMEAVGVLAGGVAHDFNNILSALAGFASLAQMKLAADDPVRCYIERILSLCDRAAAVAGGLLAFSRRKAVSLMPVDLNESVSLAVKLFDRLVGEGVEVKIELAGEPLVILADAGQIEQVLMNLAVNGRDAMPRGGTLTVRTRTEMLDISVAAALGLDSAGFFAVLEVADTGTGMTGEVCGRIFEPYFTTKEPDKGTGLGLAIVHGIVAQHKGAITVQSKAGAGSEFRIYLPLTSRSPECISGEKSEPLRGGETILVVEDDDTLRLAISSIAEAYGYHVIGAADGSAALEQFRQHRGGIGMVLMDIVMPGQSGKEAADAILAEAPETKILFMSGYADKYAHHKGIIGRHQHFISKPFAPDVLLRHVREMLDNA